MQINQQKGSIYDLLGLYNRVITVPAVSGIILYCFCQSPNPAKYTAAFVFLAFLLCFLLFLTQAVSATPLKIPYMPQPNEKQPSRLVIYTTDVMKIYSCSDSTAARKLSLVRDSMSKKAHQAVSIKEFCDYWGLDYPHTCEFLNLLA